MKKTLTAFAAVSAISSLMSINAFAQTPDFSVPDTLDLFSNYSSSLAVNSYGTGSTPAYNTTDTSGNYGTGTTGIDNYNTGTTGVGNYGTGTTGISNYGTGTTGVGNYNTGTTTGIDNYNTGMTGIGNYNTGTTGTGMMTGGTSDPYYLNEMNNQQMWGNGYGGNDSRNNPYMSAQSVNADRSAGDNGQIKVSTDTYIVQDGDDLWIVMGNIKARLSMMIYTQPEQSGGGQGQNSDRSSGFNQSTQSNDKNSLAIPVIDTGK